MLPRRPSNALMLAAATLAVLVLVTWSPVIGQRTNAGEVPPWRAELGGFNTLQDLAAVSTSDVHAAGSNLVHFDGRAWAAVDGREEPGSFSALDFVGPDAGWAVGYKGVTPFRDGAWGQEVALPDTQLNDVDLTGPDQGWAVGWDAVSQGAAILELADGAWRPVPIAGEVPRVLTGVWLASPDEGWAVGGSVVVHFDGRVWTGQRLPEANSLNAVAGTGPADVWAVGGPEPAPFSEPGPAWIVHFDGQRWTKVHDAPIGGLVDVTVRGGDGYAVGYEGTVLRLRSGRWENLGKLLDASRIYRVSAVAFVPGASYALAAINDGRVYRLDEGQATLVWDNLEITGLAMAAPDLGWAVSRGGALQYDGTHWNALDAASPLQQSHDVAALGPADAWAVGESGQIWHFDGRAWQAVASPVTVTLDRVRMVSPTLGWAVGNDVAGIRAAPLALTVVLRYDGRAWSAIWDKASAVFEPLLDVHGLAPDDAWVADPYGLWHFDGTDWRQQTIPRCCRSVAMASATEGWAGGDRGILRFDGGGWSEAAWIPGEIRGLAISADGTAWAAGWNGYVAYFDRSAWRIVRGPVGLSGVPWALGRVATLSDSAGTRVWVAGLPRTLLTADLADLLRRPPITPDPGETAVPFTVIPDDTATRPPTSSTASLRATVTATPTGPAHGTVWVLDLPWLSADRP